MRSVRRHLFVVERRAFSTASHDFRFRQEKDWNLHHLRISLFNESGLTAFPGSFLEREVSHREVPAVATLNSRPSRVGRRGRTVPRGSHERPAMSSAGRGHDSSRQPHAARSPRAGKPETRPPIDSEGAPASVARGCTAARPCASQGTATVRPDFHPHARFVGRRERQSRRGETRRAAPACICLPASEGPAAETARTDWRMEAWPGRSPPRHGPTAWPAGMARCGGLPFDAPPPYLCVGDGLGWGWG